MKMLVIAAIITSIFIGQLLRAHVKLFTPRTGTNRDGIRVRSYIPGSASDQTRFGAKVDHGLSR